MVWGGGGGGVIPGVISRVPGLRQLLSDASDSLSDSFWASQSPRRGGGGGGDRGSGSRRAVVVILVEVTLEWLDSSDLCVCVCLSA